MKYEDLHQIYWDVNNAYQTLSRCSVWDKEEVDERLFRLGWVLETIHQELLDIERYQKESG